MDRFRPASSGEREDEPALRALLRRPSQGAFISADEIDERLARMIDQ